jgi:diacylglycerol kinase (ATP)
VPRVRLTGRRRGAHELGVNTAAVCNGQYFGGGMHMAPMARPDDGLFDIVVMHDMSQARAAARPERDLPRRRT